MNGISLSLSHQQQLAPQQRLALAQLCQIQERLVESESFPDAARGLEGMRIAHDTLVEHKAAGILIGGVLEGVWNQHGATRLAKHKDVDVLIVTPQFTPDRFLNGVDWWHPQTAQVEVHGDASTMFKKQTWHENGFGIALPFGVETAKDLALGLHIPNERFLLEMRYHEALCVIDPKAVTIDDTVLDAFREKLSARFVGECGSEVLRSFGDNMLRHIANTSAGKLASKLYANEIVLDDFPRDVIRAIGAHRLAAEKNGLDELSLPRVANL